MNFRGLAVLQKDVVMGLEATGMPSPTKPEQAAPTSTVTTVRERNKVILLKSMGTYRAVACLDGHTFAANRISGSMWMTSL